MSLLWRARPNFHLRQACPEHTCCSGNRSASRRNTPKEKQAPRPKTPNHPPRTLSPHGNQFDITLSNSIFQNRSACSCRTRRGEEERRRGKERRRKNRTWLLVSNEAPPSAGTFILKKEIHRLASASIRGFNPGMSITPPPPSTD